MNFRLFLMSIVLTLAVLCTSSLTGVNGFPRVDNSDSFSSVDGEYDGRHTISKRDECSTHLHVRILCERCAKYTKSNLAYKMCCDSSNLEVQSWCKAFLEYDVISNK